MNKEPIGLYIFRFVLGLGLLAFMCMLYWSSVLVEDHLANLRTDIADLKNDLYDLRIETDLIRDDVLRAILKGQERKFEPRESSVEESSGAVHRPQMDPSLPNLLKEDLFYTETLLKLLGEDFKPHGTLHGATIGKPNNLHPFSNWSQV
ncbi:MAG: permease, partial [Waddliaceae bacterium]